MSKVTEKIKSVENPDLGKITSMDEFVAVCRQGWNGELVEKEIDLKIPDNLKHFTKLDPSLLQAKGLSFQISDEDIAKIANQIISITMNPDVVAQLLKDLDDALGKVMQEHNIQFNDADLPDFLIAGKGHYIPGPPPENYRPKKKDRLLDTLLLEREGKNKINVEGASPKFAGFIDSDEADPFVAAGHIFTEDKQVSRLLLHGSLSHRIMLDAIFHSKELDLKYGDGKELSKQQLIELLVNTQYFQTGINKILNRRPLSLWTLTIDTVVDTGFTPHAAENHFNPDHYSFSCRSPYVLNSNLLNFGKKFGLRNLQHYLLDSHWKAAYEMVYRVKKATPSINIPDSVIYTLCMEAITAAGTDLGDVVVKLPFTLPESAAKKDPSYVPFDSIKPIAGIVKKNKKSSGTGEYASWQDFFDHLEQQSKDISQEQINFHDFMRNDIDETKPTSQNVTDQQTPSLNYFDELKELIISEKLIINEEILDRFTEQAQAWRGIEQLVASVPKEQHKNLLEMLGSKRLIKLIEYPFTLTNIFKLLSQPDQTTLIRLLGTKHLQELTKTDGMLIEMLCILKQESQVTLLEELGKNKILNLFSLPYFLVTSIKKLQSENRNDVIVELFKFLGKEPLLDIFKNQKIYRQLEPWHGTYDLGSFKKYFGELERRLMKDTINQILHIGTVDEKNENKISITFSNSEGWTIINPHSPHPFAITSKDTEEIASIIFSTFAPDKEIISLTTQFFTNCTYSATSQKQQEIADEQCISSLSVLASKLKPEELKIIKSEFMQEAFQKNNKNLCEKLIQSGIDFYACTVEASTQESNILFNDLCEAQAKFNAENLEKKVFAMDWEIKFGGKKIYNRNYPEGKKAPGTVELELNEIIDARQGKKTYYSAWKKIIELRQEAAKHNEDFFTFFRKSPAKEHYTNAEIETPILRLKN